MTATKVMGLEIHLGSMSRLINVFRAFAMNIYESLLTCLQKSDGFIMSTYYGGVGLH